MTWFLHGSKIECTLKSEWTLDTIISHSQKLAYYSERLEVQVIIIIVQSEELDPSLSKNLHKKSFFHKKSSEKKTKETNQIQKITPYLEDYCISSI